MARDDWYRNKSWNSEIEAAFRAKLARARSMRPQYLVVQAGVIAKSYPDVALGLIDEYLGEYREFNYPTAQCVRAEVFLAQGKTSGALDAFKCALDWEQDHPSFITDAWWGYCRLVAMQGIEDEFDYAISVLSRDAVDQGGPFPAGAYQWNGCNALIADTVGDKLLAKQFAAKAIQAAEAKNSPFAFHRRLGLVGRSKDAFRHRLEKLVSKE